jgi:hypothetical protein
MLMALHVHLFWRWKDLMEAQENTPDPISKAGSSPSASKSSRHNARSKLYWGGTKRRLVAYLGVIVLAALAGCISVYWYAVSVLDSALSFLKP